MATETIVAVFDTADIAETVIRELEAAGVPSSSIQHYDKSSSGYAGRSSGATASGWTASSANASSQNLSGQDVSGGVASGGGFWSWLFGEDTAAGDHAVYDRSVESGGTVVTVIVDERQADRVVQILESHSPVNLEERASQYGLTGGASATAAAATGTGYAATSGTARQAGTADRSGTGRTEEVIPLAEESLNVGKRSVSGGTTRLRRYVVERPVEEQIRLRNERVTVERRPASGTVTTIGPDAFTEKTIEVTETAEEAVVSKTARVAEEVVVRKEVDERVETVRDTVRREQVEVDGARGSSSVSGGTGALPGGRADR